MHQRKRWLMGANELPLNWKLLFVIYGLFIPALLVFGYFNIVLALKLWTLKFALQSLFIVVLVSKAKLKFKDISTFYIGYELYLIFMTLITSLFYFLPIQSVWKGRRYSSKGLSVSSK